MAEQAWGRSCDVSRYALANLHALVKVQPGREEEAARIEEQVDIATEP